MEYSIKYFIIIKFKNAIKYFFNLIINEIIKINNYKFNKQKKIDLLYKKKAIGLAHSDYTYLPIKFKKII